MSESNVAPCRVRAIVVWLVLAYCLATPAAESFDAAKLAQMGTEIDHAIAEHRLPGGVLWLESKGQVYHKAFGSRALVPQVEPMTADTIFDVASLTKVLATAPAVMLLYERGKLRLDAPAATYLP
jgi:CubicO group peptidase (beta-lactamase class C family)